ncbi:unnamed protein product [Camellia sinensis]
MILKLLCSWVASITIVGDPCLQDRVFIYLNKPQVQEALQANTTHLSYSWSFCSGQGSGDQDSKIPLTQTRIIANMLARQLKLVAIGRYSPWYDNMQLEEQHMNLENPKPIMVELKSFWVSAKKNTETPTFDLRSPGRDSQKQGMAQTETPKGSSKLSSYDAYFETVQSRKKLSRSLQETLTAAFARIPVSSFPEVPGGKVIEILADTSISDAVKILSESNILSAPVRKPDAGYSMDWRERYIGVIDYSAIVLWVLESAELAAVALSASSATAAGVGVGAVGALGAVAFGATGPTTIAGLTVAAVGAAVVGGVAADRGIGKDAPTAADNLGEDFYKVILQEEPFKSTTAGQRWRWWAVACRYNGGGMVVMAVVALKMHRHKWTGFSCHFLFQVSSILKSYRWAPFLPVATDSSMLSVLLLLSKYRLRNLPVIEQGQPFIKNFITQSAVIHGLEGCKGRDWFDCISTHSICDLGLPFMSSDEVISIQSNELILEAFKRMKDNQIGGLPVVDGPNKKIIGNVSIRDIRYLLLKPELFSNFRHLTVMDFMNTITATSDDTGKVVTALTCKPDSTLGAVIHSLSSNSVHRIYVVEGEDHGVVGVITLRDVISCFIDEPPNHLDNYFGFAMQEMFNE